MNEQSEITPNEESQIQEPTRLLSRRQLVGIGVGGAAVMSIAPSALLQMASAAPKPLEFRTNKKNLKDVYIECNPDIDGDVNCQQCLVAIATSMDSESFNAWFISVAANFALPAPKGGDALPDSTVHNCALDCEGAGHPCADDPNSPHKKRDIVVSFLHCVLSDVAMATVSSLAYSWLEYLRTQP